MDANLRERTFLLQYSGYIVITSKQIILLKIRWNIHSQERNVLQIFNFPCFPYL